MQILLITLGSAGDVHPFVGLALRLRERGHEMTLMSSGYFSDLASRAGLAFESLGTPEQFTQISENPDLWHARKGLSVMAGGISQFIAPMYEKIENYIRRFPHAVMVGSSLAFGARMIQEKFRTPLVTVHLSPGTIRSLHDMSKVPGVPISTRSPRWLKRGFFALADRLVVDRAMGIPLNRFRRQIGLKPVSGIVRSWWHSPLRVIGFWPDWFAAPQPDWPSQVRLTGFPLWDESELGVIDPAMEEFLDSGPPPVAFTPGSANMHGGKFFEAAVAACAMANVRGLLLSRHRQHLPAALPPDVAHFEYAPFSQLLPRCAALVHHGGIGTTAQALAAGTPQIVTPLSFDQFDNAARAQKIGCAITIGAKPLRVKKLARAISIMMNDAPHHRCQEMARRFEPENWMEQSCALIEQTANQPVRH